MNADSTRHPVWLIVNSLYLLESAIQEYQEYLDTREDGLRVGAGMDGVACLFNLFDSLYSGDLVLITPPPFSAQAQEKEEAYLNQLFKNYKIIIEIFRKEALKYNWEKDSPERLTGYNPATDLKEYPELLTRKLILVGLLSAPQCTSLSKSA